MGSLAKPLSLRVDAWALINESVNSALLEAINVTEFSQNYKVVQDEEAVFTHSVPSNTIQIPTHGKYQFHVTPKLNKQRLLSLMESDSENISHRYNSIALKEILEFSSLSHKITFPLHLSCDLPELKISCEVINFGDVFYGKSVAKEFSITK